MMDNRDYDKNVYIKNRKYKQFVSTDCYFLTENLLKKIDVKQCLALFFYFKSQTLTNVPLRASCRLSVCSILVDSSQICSRGRWKGKTTVYTASSSMLLMIMMLLLVLLLRRLFFVLMSVSRVKYKLPLKFQSLIKRCRIKCRYRLKRYIASLFFVFSS